MRYIFIAWLLLFTVALVPVFASNAEPTTELASEPATESDTESGNEPASEPEIVSEEITRTVSPVTPSNSNGLKKIMLQLIGDYNTIVTEHRYTNSNGYTSVSIDIQEDHPWIAACCAFLLVLFCVFRLLGGMLRAGR